MQLLDNPASPYCRKVKVLLHEAGRAADVELLASAGHPTDPNTAAQSHNPLGKIPTLLRGDGPAIYDSRVICRFLDDRFGQKFYPAARLWETLTVEATADGMMDAAVLMVYETRSRPAEKRDEGWIDAQWQKVSKAVDVLESRWMSHLTGPLDMGQMAVACALSYLDFRHADRDWRSGRTSLADWHSDFAQRPSMQATMPPDA